MATYSKQHLVGSTDGKPIKIAATATGDPGTAIHTAIAGTTDFDEIWLWAYNSSASSVVLTIEFGGTAAPDQNIVTTLASQSGLIPIIPGLILQNGLYVTAFAGTTNVVTVVGFVNRIVA
jgi:hypothetical protein